MKIENRCGVINCSVISFLFFFNSYAFGAAKNGYGHHRSTASNGSGTLGAALVAAANEPSPTQSHRALSGVAGVTQLPYRLDSVTEMPDDSSREGTQTSQHTDSSTPSSTLQVPQPGNFGGYHSRHQSYNATSLTQATNLVAYANPGNAAIERAQPSWCARLWAACCCCNKKLATPVKKDRPNSASSDSPLLTGRQPMSSEL